MSDDPLGHILQVCTATRHVAAHRLEDVLIGAERLEHGALGCLSAADPLLDVFEHRRILRHQRLRLENVLRIPSGPRAEKVEIIGRGSESVGRSFEFDQWFEFRGDVLGLGQRLGHPQHRTNCDTPTDSDARDLHD